MSTFTSAVAVPSTILALLSCFVSRSTAAPATTSSATYTLQQNYAGSNFFNGFSFFNAADPTHGFVTYVDQATAQKSGLITAVDGAPVIIGVDHKNTYDSSANYWNINGVGRPSVRITSNFAFTHGLVIADLNNMPGGVCGTWPAMWTLGTGTWPYSGEIDFIEGVHTNTQNVNSLHTGGTCSMPSAGAIFSGSVSGTDCEYYVSTGQNAVGCQITSSSTQSFGAPFNSNRGGVYAMEWTSSYIKTWFFPRSGAIPSDITNGTPNPSSWPTPFSNFQGNCNIDNNFKNHQLVLDTTFCGDWAGNVWQSSGCQAATKAASCAEYVGNNPSAFSNVYWSINSIKIYQSGVPAQSSSTTSSNTPTSTRTTTSSSSTTTKSPSTTPTSSSSTTVNKPSSSATTTTSSASSTCTNGAIITAASGRKYVVACNTDYRGGDLSLVYTTSLTSCIQACDTRSGCIDVSFAAPYWCYMKSSLQPAVSASGVNAAKLVTATPAAAAANVRTPS